MNLHFNITAPRGESSPTESSAACGNFRVYSRCPFPPVLFEEAHKSSRHSKAPSLPIGWTVP